MNIHAIPSSRPMLSRLQERAIIGFLAGESDGFRLRIVANHQDEIRIEYNYREGGDWYVISSGDQKYYAETYCPRNAKLDPNHPRVEWPAP